MQPADSSSRRKPRPDSNSGMKSDQIQRFWQPEDSYSGQDGNVVVSLFALSNCARPLAGPPDHRAGSAFAPDPQARAVTPNPWVLLPGNSPSNLHGKSQPADSLASSNPSSIFAIGETRTVMTASIRTAPSQASSSFSIDKRLSTLAFLPPCLSASLGRNWACPSSSTSKAKPSRSH